MVLLKEGYRNVFSFINYFCYDKFFVVYAWNEVVSAKPKMDYPHFGLDRMSGLGESAAAAAKRHGWAL